MDADWYVDPLDRFDGRFFDGERWTERVSSDGQLAIDAEFVSQTEPADRPSAPADSLRFRVREPRPAMAPTERRTVRPNLPAADITESAVRTLAVLDAVPGASPGPNRRYLLWGLLGLVAALAIIGLLLLRGDDAAPAAEPVDLAGEQAQRVDDLEAGGVDDGGAGDVIDDLEVDAPVGAVEPGATFDADELIEVGALRVLNGTSVLHDLATWHRDFAAARGIELPKDAGCWFGQLGGAAVQVAHCGPVGETAENEFLYDGVPLAFQDVPDGDIAQPVVDAVTIDEVLANALTLIGPNAPEN